MINMMKMKNYSKLPLIAILFTICISCQETKTTESEANTSGVFSGEQVAEGTTLEKGWTDLEVSDFKKGFEENKEAVLIDIRTPDEWATGVLEGAQKVDWFVDFKAQTEGWDKEKAYYLYCRSGGRSRSASDFMSTAGFKEVYNMLGGIRAWNSAEYPVVTDK